MNNDDRWETILEYRKVNTIQGLANDSSQGKDKEYDNEINWSLTWLYSER